MKLSRLLGCFLLAHVLVFFCVSTSLAVTWERTYGGSETDWGRSVQQTADGGYVIAGRTESFGSGNQDVYVIKTDSNGNETWGKTFGGENIDQGLSIQQTTDNGYIIAGYTYSFGAGGADVYLIKTDLSGNALWTKTYGGIDFDEANSVQQTTDGGYIIVGSTRSYSVGSRDIYLIKTDLNGNLLWTKTFGGIDYDIGKSVQQCTDGGYIIAGKTGPEPTVPGGPADGTKAYLIKTDSNGNQIWTKTFEEGDYSDAAEVQQATDGGYILAGQTNSSSDYQAYLVKTDSNGNKIWSAAFHQSDGQAAQQTKDGGYILAGFKISTTMDVYLIKTDANGNQMWTKSFGGSGSDIAYSVKQTSDGGYIISGVKEGGDNKYDVYLIYYMPEVFKAQKVHPWIPLLLLDN